MLKQAALSTADRKKSCKGGWSHSSEGELPMGELRMHERSLHA